MKMREDWKPRIYRVVNIERLLKELNSEKYERQETLRKEDSSPTTDFAAGAVYGLNFAIAALKSEVFRTMEIFEPPVVPDKAAYITEHKTEGGEKNAESCQKKARNKLCDI